MKTKSAGIDVMTVPRRKKPVLPECPRLHRPYASMNWIRFNGSLRALAVSQPLAGTPLVNAAIKNLMASIVKLTVHCAALHSAQSNVTGY